ncbi:MAG: Minf_1886 family protein [Pirellulales bacterium]
MAEKIHPIIELLQQDQRFHLEAYQFVREALAYAQDVLKMPHPVAHEGDRHLTGQQLCEAIRQYALDQFGFMAKTVLNSWGVYSTGDFGEIVYNLIRIKQMKKSESDRREDFDDVYEFDSAFDPVFELSGNDEA